MYIHIVPHVPHRGTGRVRVGVRVSFGSFLSPIINIIEILTIFIMADMKQLTLALTLPLLLVKTITLWGKRGSI